MSTAQEPDDSRKLRISNALRRYREVVEEHNRWTLQIIYDVLMSTPRPDMSESATRLMRVKAFEKFFNGWTVPRLTEPEQFLSLDYPLDGTCHGPVSSRQACFATIAAELNIDFPPPDLEYLYSLTNYIRGPGLGWYLMTNGIDLYSEVLDQLNLRVIIPSRGLSQDLQFEDMWDEDIAVGVLIGDKDSGTGGSYAIYCLKDGVWAWRYGVRDEDWPSPLFDTVEEYLEFFLRFQAPTEETIRADARRWSKLR